MQKRHSRGVHGGLWEFPGGKVEPGETLVSAAVREIAEELALRIDPEALGLLTSVSGPRGESRPGEMLELHLLTCRRWSGDVDCTGGEDVRWLAIQDVPALAMPPLDYPLAESLAEALANGRV